MYYTHNYLLNPTHRIQVMVIGVGGTGSFLLAELVALSQTLKELGKKPFQIKVFDDDVVEPHNVFKQKFFEADIGKYKAEVLVNRINRAYGSDVEFYTEKLYDIHTANDTLPNIIISCVDNVQSRIQIDKSIKKNIAKRIGSGYNNIFYWIDCGNSKDFGQVFLSSYTEKKKKDRLPSIVDLNPLMKDDVTAPSCSMRAALLQQSFMINKMTGVLAIQMLATMFLDWRLEYSQIYFSLKKMSIKTNKI